MLKIRLTFSFLLAIASAFATPAAARECFVYFGTFTGEASKGIYLSRLDQQSGRLSAPELAASIANPSFLALAPDGRFLYAATRGDAGREGVAVFARDVPSGALTLKEVQSSEGAGPCHVSADASGQAVLVANYGGGSVKSFHVQSDGRLGDGSFVQHQGRSVNPRRQQGPHAHCMLPAPEGRFALACDLGLDQVLVYRLNPSNATLRAHQPPFAPVPPGSGPRQLVFSPDGKSAYVINEMSCTVTAFDWNALSGALAPRETVSLLPSGVELTNSFTAAAIAIRPDGRFIFGTVRGHDSVSVLAVDERRGRLSLVQNVPCGGKVPRGMGLDPTGRWLIVAHQKSNTVIVFGIHTETGRLTPAGESVSVGSPVDVKCVPIAY